MVLWEQLLIINNMISSSKCSGVAANVSPLYQWAAFSLQTNFDVKHPIGNICEPKHNLAISTDFFLQN